MFVFFQAEDGIRYYKVTGVQTCALPIFEGLDAALHLRCLRGVGGEAVDEALLLGQLGLLPLVGSFAVGLTDGALALVERSEERRVGKEGRSRRSPYH